MQTQVYKNMQKKLWFMDPTQPQEFPVKRVPVGQAIPSHPEPSWVDEAELAKLRQQFRGTTPQGREIIRKIVLRARRVLFEKAPGQLNSGGF